MKRLFQQYVCNVYAVVDQNKLNWLCNNQKSIQANVYNGLADSMVQNDVNTKQLGQQVVLLSFYTSGDRYIQQQF